MLLVTYIDSVTNYRYDPCKLTGEPSGKVLTGKKLYKKYVQEKG